MNIENNSEKHFHSTHCHRWGRAWGYFMIQSNRWHLLTNQLTIPSPLHQRPPSRLPHPGSRDPHPNSLFLQSLLCLVLGARHRDRNKKDKRQPPDGVHPHTADPPFQIRNVDDWYIRNVLIGGTKAAQSKAHSPCPQRAYTLTHVKLTQGMNEQSPFHFYFFLMQTCPCVVCGLGSIDFMYRVHLVGKSLLRRVKFKTGTVE